MTYYILNSSGPASEAESVAGAVAQKIVSAALVAAVTETGALLGAEMGAAIGTEAVPLVGSAIGALAGFVVGEIWGLAFPNCDGPVALGVRAYSAAELSTTSGAVVTDEQPSPGMQPPMVTQDGCGSNPQYQVFWSIKPA